MIKINQKKYKKNLIVSNNYIYSYNTKVAYISSKLKKVIKIDYKFKFNNKIITNSKTTSKHINYIANLYNYEINK